MAPSVDKVHGQVGRGCDCQCVKLDLGSGALSALRRHWRACIDSDPTLMRISSTRAMNAETHVDVRQVERANSAAATSASLCRYEPSNLCEDINTGVAKGKGDRS